MRTLQYKPRFYRTGKAQFTDRDIGDGAKTNWQIINLANTVDIITIFQHFDIHLDAHHKKICCPFPFHNERSASFYYYPATNSFFCFGCKNGGNAVEFVVLTDTTEKTDAAKHILSQFSSEVRSGEIANYGDFAEKQKILLKFSSSIRNYIQENIEDETALEKAEKITFIFDELNKKNSISNDGLVVLIEKLKVRLYGK